MDFFNGLISANTNARLFCPPQAGSDEMPISIMTSSLCSTTVNCICEWQYTANVQNYLNVPDWAIQINRVHRFTKLWTLSDLSLKLSVESIHLAASQYLADTVCLSLKMRNVASSRSYQLLVGQQSTDHFKKSLPVWFILNILAEQWL